MKESTKHLFNIITSTKKIIEQYFGADNAFSMKSDNSPITIADLAVNSHLVLSLKKIFPNVAIISEENEFKDNLEAFAKDEVFIIDPLDGTSSFIKGSPEFTVNIALKINDRLACGMIYSPIEDILFFSENNLLFKVKNASKSNHEILKIVATKFCKKDKMIVIATRRADELQEIKEVLSKSDFAFDFISFSSSLKFCYLAEGIADIYYRAAKIKLWDVAAGFAIVKAAGFEIIDHDGNDLLEKILDKNYIKTLKEDGFRIDKFIIKKPDLKLF